MVNTCCVNGCTARSSVQSARNFYRIPKIDTTRGTKIAELTQKRRRAWLQQINRKTVTELMVKSWTRVCSKHFLSGKPAELYDEQNPDWIPSLHMGYQCKTGSMVRFERAKKRTECQLQPKPEMNASASEDMSVEKQADMDREDSTCDLCVQTMPYLESLEYLGVQTMPYLESEVQSLRLEISELKEKLDCYTFSEKSFQDQTRVKYYKGLPNFLMLMALFNYLSPYISSGPRIVTTKFQELLMVLMRLRLSLPVQVIADMFLVSQSTASRIFLKVIDVMYTRLNPLIIWPDRKNLQETMPREFQQYFRKVTVIIDCFELFIETPSNLKARTQTFSSYKHHNTIKYLTGITPQGVVSYISSGWGGRTSDKCLTENCSFLDNLLPGDLVLAHWGFNIQESVGLMCAEVKIPAFTKGKKQLSAFDVEST